MYLYAIYVDKVLIYVTGVEHVEGDMFENVPEGHAIFMKVSFIGENGQLPFFGKLNIRLPSF